MRTRLLGLTVAALVGVAAAVLPLSPASAFFWFGALPPGPVSGVVTVLVSASSNTDAGSLWVGDTRVTSVFGPLSGRPITVDTTTLPDGPQAVAIKDAAGTTVLAPGGTLVVDNTAPDVDVSDVLTWNPLGLTFGYAVADANPSSTPAECSVVPVGEAPQWNPCLTDSTQDLPTPSSYQDFTFSVRATDAAGNVGTGSATVSYRAPTVDLDQVPDVLGASDLVTLAPTVTDFSPGQTVRLSVDGHHVAVWDAPPFAVQVHPPDWGEGVHDLAVQIDSPSPSFLASAFKHVAVDLTRPTLIVAPVDGDPLDTTFTSERPPGWTVAATDLHEPVITTCTVTDAGGHVWATATCGAGVFAPTGLPQGALTLTVIATDAAGNRAADQIPVLVDTVAPVLDVRAAPAAVAATVPAVTFTSDNGLAGRSVDYDCVLDGEPLVCSTADLDPDGDDVLTLSLPGLADGGHDLRLRAHEVGNTGSWTDLPFTVDTHAPQLDAGAGLQTLTGPSVTVAYTASDLTPLTVSCSLEPAEHAPVWAPCPDGGVTTTAAPGTYVFLVRATDAAGNTAFDQAVVTVVLPTAAVDRTPPSVRVTVKPKPRVHLHGRRSVRVRLRFATSEPATYRCKVDAGPWAACSATLVVKARQGRHVVRVVAVDAAGNTSAPAVVRWQVVR